MPGTTAKAGLPRGGVLITVGLRMTEEITLPTGITRGLITVGLGTMTAKIILPTSTTRAMTVIARTTMSAVITTATGMNNRITEVRRWWW